MLFPGISGLFPVRNDAIKAIGLALHQYSKITSLVLLGNILYLPIVNSSSVGGGVTDNLAKAIVKGLQVHKTLTDIVIVGG
jgi:hypothetical protein